MDHVPFSDCQMTFSRLKLMTLTVTVDDEVVNGSRTTLSSSSVDHVLLPGLLPTEADYVDGTTRDKIMSTFKSGDEEALSDLVRNGGGEVRASS